jgi:drug/metabolite transporter (DMT)-like permease
MLKRLPLAAAAVTGILVGAAMVATRFVIDQMSPASLAFLRYLIGTCCLLPALLASEPARYERRDLLPIALLGIAQFGILIALLNYALQFIPAARAALIFATLPLLARARRRPRPRAVDCAEDPGPLLTSVGVGLR